MRKILYIIICMPLMLLLSCDLIHEWPEPPEHVKLRLCLSYQTAMTEWLHTYNEESVLEQGIGEEYDNHQSYGTIRYVVRLYPVSQSRRTAQSFTQEFCFERDIAQGYDHEVILDVMPGNYTVMVWSDLVEHDDDESFYNAENFAEIVLNDTHSANTHYRDAFYGTSALTLVGDIVEREPQRLDIAMQRPLALFEFVTDDLAEFVDKEITRLNLTNGVEDSGMSQSGSTRVVTLEDYRVVFYYVGFMPNAFSIVTNKPVDSATGVLFDATLKELSDTEASLGFDYVFVNGTRTNITVQIAIYDKAGTQLSITESIEIPLMRNHHTILRGSFLMQDAQGGINIDPGYDGDHNLIL